MAPDLTRIASLPGMGGGIASHPRLEQLLPQEPEAKESPWAAPRPELLMHFTAPPDRAVQARAKALAALDRAEAYLPDPPSLHAVADPVLGWRLTPLSQVVRLLHTPPPAARAWLGEQSPALPRHFL